MNLVYSYEQLKEFNKAISVLQNFKPYHKLPTFIDSRIDNIKVKISQQPSVRIRRR